MMIQLNGDMKKKILNYLKSGKEIAAAPGLAQDHHTGEYLLKEPLFLYSDGTFEWTSEEVYNFEKYDEIFDNELFEKIMSLV